LKGDNKLTNHNLEKTAAKGRLLAVQMVYEAASGHPGGSLSSMDLLTALYFSEMRINPSNPNDPNRDRFVMSKGHCTPAVYAVLALRGFFPEDRLKDFRRIDAHLSGHVEMNHVAGVDMSTGSLGQGISAAVGIALGGKISNKDYRVYSMLGDGEIAEGQVWEAFLSAAKFKLDNLCAIVDVNGLQIDGATADVMPTEPLDDKFRSFGAHVIKIDGHNYDQILAAYAKAKVTKGKPTVILAKTIKGKGVSYMENQAGWHGKAPNSDQFAIAKNELEAIMAGMEG
jgi:transketolase